MYILASLSDVVQIHPKDFNKPSARAIEEFINAKYANKVIHKVGLCVGFHSIIATSEGLIGHGSGIVHVNVDFRMIIFRPFKGEIVNATIVHAAATLGIGLSHDFFEDAIVPPETLFDGTEWGRDDQGVESFIWYQRNEEDDEPNLFFFDRTEKCLYRVEEEQWHDLSPKMHAPEEEFMEKDPPASEDDDVRKTPYLIRGSMMLSGLGPTLWWMGDDEFWSMDDEEQRELEDGNDSANGGSDVNGDADVCSVS